MSRRRTFDFLHLELSLVIGKNLPRMKLWEDVSEKCECDPSELDMDQAADYCANLCHQFLLEFSAAYTQKQLRRASDRLAQSIQFPTPEEVFERLCIGSSGK